MQIPNAEIKTEISVKLKVIYSKSRSLSSGRTNFTIPIDKTNAIKAVSRDSVRN